MSEPLRLSKRMSELGLCSRREADEWIAKGWVRVDGQVISELGSKVLPHQKITIEKQAQAQQARRVTVLINKPMGFVSGQAEDGYQPAVTLVRPENRWSQDKSALQFSPAQLKSLVPAGQVSVTVFTGTTEKSCPCRTARYRVRRPAGAHAGRTDRQAVDW